VEEHAPLRIGPRHDGDAPADPRPNAELLVDLALEARFE
jgi:hypothetical protein